jgi:hypothetical protein
LLDLILTMRDRDEIADRAEEPSLREEIAALRTENEMLRRAARAAGLPAIPTEADVVPPGELGEFYVGGPKPGPDDPKPPVTIEAKAAPAADMVDLRAGFNDTREPWREYLDARHDRWADNRE